MRIPDCLQKPEGAGRAPPFTMNENGVTQKWKEKNRMKWLPLEATADRPPAVILAIGKVKTIILRFGNEPSKVWVMDPDRPFPESGLSVTALTARERMTPASDTATRSTFFSSAFSFSFLDFDDGIGCRLENPRRRWEREVQYQISFARGKMEDFHVSTWIWKVSY